MPDGRPLDLNLRAKTWARRLWPVVALVTAVSVPATILTRLESLAHYREHGVAWLAPLMVVVSLHVIGTALRRDRESKAFLGSCGYLRSMLVGAAAGLYSVLLPTVGTAGREITIERALAGLHSVRVGWCGGRSGSPWR